MKKVALLLVAMTFIGCASRGAFVTVENGPGFFVGLWRGMIAPIAFIAHVFIGDIAVYASPNNGGWYDFGFLLGIGAVSSIATSAAR